jgi:hypothetical protein
MKEQETKYFRVDEEGVLWFKDRLVVPKDRELRNHIMSEAHSSKLAIHPSSSKIAAYVARCDTCCRVKAMHMKAGLLQPLSILGWKWEEIGFHC